jgi:hypothetical protein
MVTRSPMKKAGLSNIFLGLCLSSLITSPAPSLGFPIGQAHFGSAVFGDTDGDNVQDSVDAFPLNPAETRDRDNDGFGDNQDLFPNIGSEWSDQDGDGFGDNGDAFPFDPEEWLDSDADGLGDNADSYPNINLGNRADFDADGIPDDCDETCFALGMVADLDDDNDGVMDEIDLFPFDGDEWSDLDGDKLGDNADPDTDGDGVTNVQELADGTDPMSAMSCKFCLPIPCPNCAGPLDVDANGKVSALSDGLIIIRYLFQFRDDVMIRGAIASDALITDPSTIESHLDSLLKKD